MLSLTLHNRVPYHIKTSPLICSGNQWTGFYMIGTSAMKELITALLFGCFSVIHLTKLTD